jgi:hypothetical protein
MVICLILLPEDMAKPVIVAHGTSRGALSYFFNL